MIASVAAFLARPGVQSSEFKVLTACTVWIGLNLGENWVPVWQSIAAAAPGIVYAVARGLAKTETRNQGTGGA